MSPEEARKLADGYEERQIKYEKKLFTRLKNYFKNKKEEREVNKRLKYYLNKIHDAAVCGKYDITIKEYFNDYDIIDIICRKKLKEDGYNITYEVKDWGTAYTISWKKNK